MSAANVWLRPDQGLAYLHSRVPPVIHRDLSSSNVLLDKNGNAKITDFGLSKLKVNSKIDTKEAGGTGFYLAPEVFREKKYDEKSDVYSWGVLSWEILARKIPWQSQGFTVVQVLYSVRHAMHLLLLVLAVGRVDNLHSDPVFMVHFRLRRREALRRKLLS
eukprot:scaffold412_cov388-Prasinococcus_capsulatus_cf.AAC.49